MEGGGAGGGLGVADAMKNPHPLPPCAADSQQHLLELTQPRSFSWSPTRFRVLMGEERGRGVPPAPWWGMGAWLKVGDDGGGGRDDEEHHAETRTRKGKRRG